MSEPLDDAIRAFRAVIGDGLVLTDEGTRRRYEAATFRTDHRVPAIVYPESREQVQACMRIATAHRVPIYPISTGRNVGYGSRVPTADGCVVIELSRMRRIIEVDQELAYVTLEPGVTQQQLYDYLHERQIPLWMDATGSTKDHSVLGNVVERGFGHTAYGDHFANVGGLEVVLPTGESFSTGFGRYPGAKAAGVYRWGVGAYLDGLFTQSNFGVVTRMTLWLMPAPEYVQKFFFSVEDDGKLSEVIDLLRPLRLDGTLQSAVHVANDIKGINAIQSYPWEQTGGTTPLPDRIREALSRRWGIGAWNATGTLTGSRPEVALARARLKRCLSGRVTRLRFVDEAQLRRLSWLKGPRGALSGIDLSKMLRLLEPLFGLNRGIPTDAFMASTYWRKRGEIPDDPDPDRDRCGQLWLAPVAPATGEHAQAIWRLAQDVTRHFGFEPLVSITLITGRALDCVIGIAFDRDVDGEDQRALDCHDRLLGKLTTAGYMPYRLGVASMGRLPVPEPGYLQFHDAIKNALDPARILSPGRYEDRRR